MSEVREASYVQNFFLNLEKYNGKCAEKNTISLEESKGDRYYIRILNHNKLKNTKDILNFFSKRGNSCKMIYIPCEPLPPRIGVISDEIESTISNRTWLSAFCSRTNLDPS